MPPRRQLVLERYYSLFPAVFDVCKDNPFFCGGVCAGRVETHEE